MSYSSAPRLETKSRLTLIHTTYSTLSVGADSSGPIWWLSRYLMLIRRSEPFDEQQVNVWGVPTCFLITGEGHPMV